MMSETTFKKKSRAEIAALIGYDDPNDIGWTKDDAYAEYLGQNEPAAEPEPEPEPEAVEEPRHKVWVAEWSYNLGLSDFPVEPEKKSRAGNGFRFLFMLTIAELEQMINVLQDRGSDKATVAKEQLKADETVHGVRAEGRELLRQRDRLVEKLDALTVVEDEEDEAEV